mgnify:CR=1 FL=1
MFDIITKEDYWSYMDRGLVRPATRRLKNAQDGYALDRLQGVSGARILEVGGGESRVLDEFASNGNECWNADDFKGSGNGPVTIPDNTSYKISPVLLGEFSPELPDGFFDYVFSISVVEHIPGDVLVAFFADACRVLKPGGVMFHAIDLYLYDDHETPHATKQRTRVQAYLDTVTQLPLEWQCAPAIGADVTFRTRYAANSDEQLYNWSRSLPNLRPVRAAAQNSSIKAEWVRTSEGLDAEAYLNGDM